MKKKVSISIDESETPVSGNIFEIVKQGRIYFLSKLSGKIDVVHTNLDGTDRQVILPATGYETETGTVLIASRDWQHIAVKSTRNKNGNESITYINTKDNTVKEADEGTAAFSLSGWYEDKLVYTVVRNVENVPEKYKLKTYDAITGTISLLETTAFASLGVQCYYYCYEQYSYDTISYATLVEGGIIYVKTSYNGPTTTTRILRSSINNTDKKELLTTTDNLQYFLAWDPVEAYFSLYKSDTNKTTYYEVAFNENVTEITDEKVKVAISNGNYNAYLLSPNGNSSFWTEPRDGKNVFFVGSKTGENPQEIATLSEYAAYGWYTNDYLLLTKNSSEMLVMPVSGGTPVKITDYHKPENGYRPYGYGYGG